MSTEFIVLGAGAALAVVGWLFNLALHKHETFDAIFPAVQGILYFAGWGLTMFLWGRALGAHSMVARIRESGVDVPVGVVFPPLSGDVDFHAILGSGSILLALLLVSCLGYARQLTDRSE